MVSSSDGKAPALEAVERAQERWEEERAAAFEAVTATTEQLERIQSLASAAINAAGRERANAIRRAVDASSVKEVAEELGISIQRVYSIIRG